MSTTTTPRGIGDMDAPHLSSVTPAEDARTILINQINWSAVFAGVVTALAIHIILNLVEMGVGAATLDPQTGDNPDVQTFSAVAGLWWTASGLLASLLGGYVAGRTCGQPKESTAGFHGLVSWATTTLVIFFMITSSAGAIVGGIYGTLSGVVAQTSNEAVSRAGSVPDPLGELKNRAQQMTGQDPANVTPEAKQRAAEAAETTADTVAVGSIFAAISLLLGAAADGSADGWGFPVRVQ